MIDSETKPIAKPGHVGECDRCRESRKIFCRGICHRCYKRLVKKQGPKDPSRQGIGGRAPMPGEGDFIVVLCKPGDAIQDEIPILRHKTAKKAREDCQRRNTASRLRGGRSKCFYFVGVNRTIRLPWIDRMLAKLEVTKGEQAEA